MRMCDLLFKAFSQRMPRKVIASTKGSLFGGGDGAAVKAAAEQMTDGCYDTGPAT